MEIKISVLPLQCITTLTHYNSMINLQNVKFAYRNKMVFDDLTLGIGQGSIYGLLGKNGAGKTTLLKLMSGLLMPAGGTIEIQGENPAKRTPSLLSQIFVLPEEFDLPRMDIVEYAKYHGVFYPNFSQKDLVSHLSQLNVSSSQKMHQMSFGQKKKAYIAFALACNTPLLLMDEPTNGLDIPSKGEFRRLLSSITDQSRTIVISTHQVRDLDQLIDSVIILEGSQILLNASCTQVTEKLLFTHIENDSLRPIYSEKTIHGTWGVVENTDHQESPLDMEILFNAVTTNPLLISKIFNCDEK